MSTTIIESGIDIPTANTMIILDADRFGLADLHQLRGRVGRSKHRAYCYLMLPEDRPVRDVARKRLKAVEQFSMLGAGFKIAMRDLEIRGAGNILGAEQSGHIAAVGYEMYCRLLQDAVRDLRNEKRPEPAGSVAVEIGAGGAIPRTYIPSDARRLEAYRRLADAPDEQAVRRLEADLTHAYGTPPKVVSRLLDLASLRVSLAALGATGVTIRGKDVVFRAHEPEPLRARLATGPKSPPATVTVLRGRTPGEPAEVYFRPPEPYLEPGTLLAVLRTRLDPGPQRAAT